MTGDFLGTGASTAANADAYVVLDESEVKDALKDLGVHSVTQIRQSHGSKHHHIGEVRDAEQLGLAATGSPDQLAADLDALTRAGAQLGSQAIMVTALLTEASHLATPMSDGTGPIAHAMRAHFHERANDTEGALRALTDYRQELLNVLDAINQTLTNYGYSEAVAASQLNRTGGQDG